MKFPMTLKISHKMLLPRGAIGLLSGLAIFIVSSFVFDDLRSHRIPELLAINALRADVLTLAGEYHRHSSSPTSAARDRIKQLRKSVEARTEELRRQASGSGEVSGSLSAIVPAHDHTPFELIGDLPKGLFSNGDALVKDRLEIAQALDVLEQAEEAITENVARAKDVIAREIEEFRNKNSWKPLVEASLPELEALANLSSTSHALLSELREHVLVPTEDSLDDLKTLEAALVRYVNDFARTAKHYPEELPFIAKFQNEIERLIEHSAVIRDKRKGLESSLLGLQKSSEAFQTVLESIVVSTSAGTGEAASRALYVILATVVLSLAVSLAFYWQVSRQVAGPIIRLGEAAARFNEENLDVRVKVETKDEVGQLAELFNAMASNLAGTITNLKNTQNELIRKERLATVGQVTATVSHELRNPLGAIRSASDAIKKLAGAENAQMNRAIALLERSQVRCDKIISELLDYTRVQPLDRRSTRIDTWLANLLDDVQFPSGIEIKTSFESDVEIDIDQARMERAVRNVLDNAAQSIVEKHDADPDGLGEIKLSARTVDDWVELSVEDTGVGIPADISEDIFEPLFSTKSIGVGLGLPLVKQIMAQHDGTVELTSTLGSGTTFCLRLPLTLQQKI